MMNWKWCSALILLCRISCAQYVPSGGGNAATANALAAAPTQCAAGTFPLGIAANGNAQTCTRLPQLFFGIAAPGSVAGNLPGDLFSDTANHNDYWCNAPSGTAAPACISVTAGGWTLLNVGGTSGLGSAGTDIKTIGAKCDGITDDSAAFTTAATSPGTWYLPNGTCIVAAISSTASNVHWIGNDTVLKHKSGDTANWLLLFNNSAGNSVKGVTFDANGVTVLPGTGGDAFTFPSIVAVTNSDTVTFEDDSFINSTGTANNGGLFLYNSGGNLDRDTFTNVDGGGNAQLYINAMATSHTQQVRVDTNTFIGGNWNQIQAASSGTNNPDIDIENSYFANVGQQAGNTGQTGNAISFFAMYGKVTARGNHIYKPAYTGIRFNQTSGGPLFGLVDSNVVDGAGETALYSEFQNQGVIFSNNTVENGEIGITSTNPGTNAVPNLIQNNTCYNMSFKCFHVEVLDRLIGNTAANVPIGAEVGYGGTGNGGIIANNHFANATIGIGVDSGLSASPAYQLFGNILNNVTLGDGQAQGVVSLAYSSHLTISNITQQNPAVVTYTGTQPTVGQTYEIDSIYGMTQINGNLCQVSASTPTTFTCGGAAHTINSLGYSGYATSPTGDQIPEALLIYSSGTTWANSLPSNLAFDSSFDGHTLTHGGAPAISSCGTTPSVTGDDSSGAIQVGSGTVTACTVTFATPWPGFPTCLVQTSLPGVTAYVSSDVPTAITITTSASVGGAFLNYACQQHQ